MSKHDSRCEDDECPGCYEEQPPTRAATIEAAARELLEARKPIVCRKNRKGGHDFTHTAGEFPFRRFCGYCGEYYDKAEHSEEQRKKREDAAARELEKALAEVQP